MSYSIYTCYCSYFLCLIILCQQQCFYDLIILRPLIYLIIYDFTSFRISTIFFFFLLLLERLGLILFNAYVTKHVRLNRCYDKCEFFFIIYFMHYIVGFTSTSAIFGGSRAVMLPEHTCHKMVNLTKCDLQNCGQECSKEPYGFGVCKENVCVCTYYCKNPPV